MNWFINKKIGQSIIITEGQKEEVLLLKQIFYQLLDYNVETIIHRCGTEDFEHTLLKSKSNKSDKVLVFNARNSNIKFAKDQDFFNYIYKILINEFNSIIDIDNSKVYYIFDRDPMSNNNIELIRELIMNLGNSYENDDYQSGLLLLSYPSVQSYLISTVIDDSYNLEFSKGKEVKKYIGEQRISVDISKQGIEHSYNEFVAFINKFDLNSSWKEIFGVNSENYSKFSLSVFELEEKKYKSENKYHLFSLFIILLFDMGIIDFSV